MLVVLLLLSLELEKAPDLYPLVDVDDLVLLVVELEVLVDGLVLLVVELEVLVEVLGLVVLDDELLKLPDLTPEEEDLLVDGFAAAYTVYF